LRQRIPASAAPVRPRLPSLAIERISALVRAKRYAVLVPLLTDTEDLNRAMLKACDAGDWRADTPPTTDGAGTSDVITPDTTADGSDQSDKSGGIGLPRAADWLDYWQNAEIPQYNTFVDFATDMTEPEFFPRSNSLPPSIGRDSDNEETSSSSKASTPREKIREILRL
jgi:hypothetical protein